MRKMGMPVALAELLLITAAPALGEVGDWRPTEQHVILFQGAIPGDLAQSVSASGGELVRQHPEVGVAITDGLTDESAAAGAGNARVARDVSVRAVPDLDQMAWSIETLPDAGATPLAHDPASAVLFAAQWNMRIIEADAAWDAGFEGTPEVNVAIIDSGIDPFHFDLAGLVDPLASIAFVPSLTGTPAWVDDNFHGTHVAGIVATNGIGTSGVAPHTTLVAIKACDALGDCPVAAIISGILYATSIGVDVINLSLGTAFPKNAPGGATLLAAFNKAVNHANRHGVLVVSGAGNDTADLQHNGNAVVTPCESGVGICVSATGPDDLLASYSNYGTSAIDVAAPGGDLIDTGDPVTAMVLAPCTTRSALPPLAGCAGNLMYLFVEGTSQAAPHVSGAAALLAAQSSRPRSAAHLKSALQRSADDLGEAGRDAAYGAGRLNVCHLVGCQAASANLPPERSVSRHRH